MGIHAMRHLNSSQKKRNARLISRKAGNDMPAVDNKGWSVGFRRSLYPMSNNRMTEAKFAPAISWIVNFFSFLITTRGFGQTVSVSPPWSDYRSRSCESCPEWHPPPLGSYACGHCTPRRSRGGDQAVQPAS